MLGLSREEHPDPTSTVPHKDRLGYSWHETNFPHFDFMLGKAEHQTYQSVIAQVGKGLTMLVCERVEFALILENNLII